MREDLEVASTDHGGLLGGTWRSLHDRELGAIHIFGTLASFQNGARMHLTFLSPTNVTMTCFPVGSGRVHRGTLDRAGRLVWGEENVGAPALACLRGGGGQRA